MKKIYIIAILFIAVLSVCIFLLRPRNVVKEGYIIKGFHGIGYTDNMTQRSDGNYYFTDGYPTVSIFFNKKNEYLYESLNNTPMMKIKFEGKYYPLSIQNTPMRTTFEPKILLENLITSEPLITK